MSGELEKRRLHADRRAAGGPGTAVSWERIPKTTGPLGESVFQEPHFDPGLRDIDVRELLDLPDACFVAGAYRVVLGREPDADGRHHYLDRLRNLELEKVEILARLRYSPEGRARGVRIRGLHSRLAIAMIFRVPVIGYLVQLPVFLLRGPGILRQLRQSDSFVTAKLFQLDRRVDHLTREMKRSGEIVSSNRDRGPRADLSLELHTLAQRVDRLEGARSLLESLQSKIESLEEGFDRRESFDTNLHDVQQTIQDQISILQSRLDSLHARIDVTDYESHLNDLSAQNADSRKRIDALTEDQHDLKRAMASIFGYRFDRSKTAEADTLRRDLDKLYTKLDDLLRGPEDEITERAKVYLSYLDRCATNGDTLLDLGSGRGEWLKLAAERGCQAIGVELNEVLAKQSRSERLNVKCADIFDFLAECEPGSIGVVSAFHVLEHFPASRILPLLRAINRTLKADGVVLLETPNPENIQVGAWRFYMDPTHVNPLPPLLLEQMLGVTGFSDPKIVRLHPMPNRAHIPEDGHAEAFINRQFFGPQDYAAIAHKDRAE